MLGSYLRRLKNNPKDTVLDTVTYYRQGAVLVNLLLQMATFSMVANLDILKGLPLWLIFLGIVTCVFPAIVILGNLDYKHGAYKSQCRVTVRNSPPSATQFKVSLKLLELLPDSKEKQDLMCGIRLEISRVGLS